ncbi:MAG: hypothetical protein ACLRFE_00745 [Clostridia bacterium]
MAGFPIRYVAREVRDNGKVVAYFLSKAHLFEERKIYSANGLTKELYEVDFVTRIHNEKYEIENGENYKRYYKDRVYTNFQNCLDYVNALNRKLWFEAIEGLMPDEVEKKRKEYKKYFEFADKMKCKYTIIELDKQNNK